nr:MAG TPA: BRO family protein [Caudoviricetes sp.]
MSNKNSLVKFGETELQLTINPNNEIEMDIEELAKALNFKDKDSFNKSIFLRNPNLQEKQYSYLKKVLNNEGGILKKREKRIFTEAGIYEVAFLANTEKAKEFRKFIKEFSKEMLTKIKKNEMVLSSGVPATFEPKLDKMMFLITKRDEEINTIFEFFEKSQDFFKKVEEMGEDIKQIKRKIDTIIEVVNDLSDEVYGADIENENNEE